MTSIVGGWDSEAEVAVDGQVGQGPKSGSGGKVEGARAGGPGLYMIEPSGLYWVRNMVLGRMTFAYNWHRVTMVQPPARDDRLRRQSWKN